MDYCGVHLVVDMYCCDFRAGEGNFLVVGIVPVADTDDYPVGDFLVEDIGDYPVVDFHEGDSPAVGCDDHAEVAGLYRALH